MKKFNLLKENIVEPIEENVSINNGATTLKVNYNTPTYIQEMVPFHVFNDTYKSMDFNNVNSLNRIKQLMGL